MAFFLQGRSHAMLGSQKRVARPGMLVHIPSNARHSFKSIDDVEYLYIKDRTWTLVGAAADEALPEEAVSATQLAKALHDGTYRSRRGNGRQSRGDRRRSRRFLLPGGSISLDAPPASGHHARWLEGSQSHVRARRVARRPRDAGRRGRARALRLCDRGALDATAGDAQRRAGVGDVIHVPRGTALSLDRRQEGPVRYAVVRSTRFLEDYGQSRRSRQLAPVGAALASNVGQVQSR